MVSMAKQEQKPSSSADLLEEAKIRLHQTYQEGIEAMKNAAYSCPVDGLPCTFVRTVGTYQIAVPVYKCPEGHEISVRLGIANPIMLLPTSSQGLTPKVEETK
jgi:hypothetical protein